MVHSSISGSRGSRYSVEREREREREREIIYIYIYIYIYICKCINPSYLQREYFVSVGIGSYLFFSVVSLSSLDEGRSFVSCKCWIPLGLVNI